jgi:SAM-dependent methyltransferase
MRSALGPLQKHDINRKRIRKGLNPANSIWLWGQGKKPAFQDFKEKYGLDVFNDYLENYTPEKRYDVILMRHSLEHFENPLEVLGKINELLNDDGVVLLVVPNIDCLGRYLFGTDWEWVLPWHCNFFNPKSIKRILASAGFTDMALYQTPSPLYFFDSLGRKLNTRLFSKLRDKWNAALLLASAPFALLGTVLGLGDNITVVARKTH